MLQSVLIPLRPLHRLPAHPEPIPHPLSSLTLMNPLYLLAKVLQYPYPLQHHLLSILEESDLLQVIHNLAQLRKFVLFITLLPCIDFRGLLWLHNRSINGLRFRKSFINPISQPNDLLICLSNLYTSTPNHLHPRIHHHNLHR